MMLIVLVLYCFGHIFLMLYLDFNDFPLQYHIEQISLNAKDSRLGD